MKQKLIFIMLLLPVLMYGQQFPLPAHTYTTVWVNSLNDLPQAVSGVIILEKDHSYSIAGNLDLQGNRIITSGVNTIYGASSESQSLFSTGLSSSIPLIESDSSVTLKDITLNHGYAVNLVATTSGQVLNWNGVNIRNSHQSNLSGFGINLESCAFIESDGFLFGGTIQSLVARNCLFGAGMGTIFTVPSSVSVITRIRFSYSSFLCDAGETAFNVDPASVNTERFNLSYCNFSGGGTYLVGVDHTHQDADFKFNTGIQNTLILDFTGWDTNVNDDFNGQYSSLGGVPTTFTPSVHTHNISDITNLNTTLNGKEPLITVGSTSDYFRGDKTFQPLNKNTVGLGNVDNTSDVNKPISSATQTALTLKQDVALKQMITSGITTTSTTLTSTGLSFAVTSGESYEVILYGRFQSSATTTGVGFTLDIPGGNIAGIVEHSLAAQTATFHSQVADNVIAYSSTGTSGVPIANSPVGIIGRWYYDCTAAGNTVLNWKSEIAGSDVTLLSGTKLIVRKI